MTYGMNSGAEFFIPLTNWLEFLLPLSPELCPDLIFAKHNFKPITDFSRAIGTNISISCQAGFLANTSLDVTYSTCQSGGVWNPRPPACESCRVRCSDDINVESCNHVMGQGTVNCVCKTNYMWNGSECELTYCPKTDPMTLMTIDKGLVGITVNASCKAGYGNITIPSTVVCQENGTWSSFPTCQVSTSTAPVTPTTTMDMTSTTSITVTPTSNNTSPTPGDSTEGDGIGTGAII
eukprot:scpid101267/ scgid4478/ 